MVFDYLYKTQLSLITSRPVELRGLYLDADGIPRTEEGISNLLDRLHKSGFNAIFPEVFRRGYTIYESHFTERDPRFAKLSFDPLWQLIRESNKRDIKVIPWVWVFRVRSIG